MRRSINQSIFSAKGATGTGNSVLVQDLRHLTLALSTAGVGAGESATIKIQGSISENAPTFSSAASATNLWDYIQVVDLLDGSFIDGDTGIPVSAANDFSLFAINTDGLRWVCATITALSGTFTINLDLRGFSA